MVYYQHYANIFFSLLWNILCNIRNISSLNIFYYFTDEEWAFLHLNISPLNICICLTLCPTLFFHLYFQSNGYKLFTGSISWDLFEVCRICNIAFFFASTKVICCFSLVFISFNKTKQYLAIYWIIVSLINNFSCYLCYFFPSNFRGTASFSLFF